MDKKDSDKKGITFLQLLILIIISYGLCSFVEENISQNALLVLKIVGISIIALIIFYKLFKTIISFFLFIDKKLSLINKFKRIQDKIKTQSDKEDSNCLICSKAPELFDLDTFYLTNISHFEYKLNKFPEFEGNWNAYLVTSEPKECTLNNNVIKKQQVTTISSEPKENTSHSEPKTINHDKSKELLNFAKDKTCAKNIEDFKLLTIQFIKKSQEELIWFYNYIYNYGVSIDKAELLLLNFEIKISVNYDEHIFINQFKHTKNELAEYMCAKYIKFDFTPNKNKCIDIIIPLPFNIICLLNYQK